MYVVPAMVSPTAVKKSVTGANNSFPGPVYGLLLSILYNGFSGAGGTYKVLAPCIHSDKSMSVVFIPVLTGTVFVRISAEPTSFPREDPTAPVGVKPAVGVTVGVVGFKPPVTDLADSYAA